MPVHQETARLPEALLDLQSFFAKLPLDIDLVIICEPGEKSDIEAVIKALPESPRPLKTQILENPRHLGRGPSLQKGLDLAQGEVLATLSADLAIPLAEIFAAIQEFLRDPEGTAFVLGNRYSLKRPRHGHRQVWKKFFDEVERDKARGLEVPDPTCPFWVIRRELWQQVSPRIKLRKWYYTAGLVRELRQLKAPLKSIDVNCHDSESTRFRWWHSVVY